MRRPGTLTAAGIITIAMSSIAFFGMALSAFFFLAIRDVVEDVERLQEASADVEVEFSTFVTFIGVMCIVFAVLCVVAVVLGVMLLQDKRVRIPLVVVSALSIVPSVLSAPVGMIWTAAAILVIVFCFVGGAQAYEADRARQQH